MKVAVLSDIHANWPALEAVLADCPPVDEVICLGDVVGYGADPVRCADEVMKRGWATLIGNHDIACVNEEIRQWFNDDAASVIRWTAEELADKQLQWLRALPVQQEIHDALLVHASPRDPTFEYILDAYSAYANLERIEDRVCFHGHTHLPGIFAIAGDEVVHEYELGEHRLLGPQLVNPGSVGQPRDGNPDASYGVWDVDASSFEFRRVPYDREAAKSAIREARLPERFASRLDSGR